MAIRLRFVCDFCAARPDEPTQRGLMSTVREPGHAPYVDVLPGRWLVWRGGGPLGPRRYACAEHRGELTAHLRLHYASVNTCVWQRPPYPEIRPDGARRPPAQARPAEGERRPPRDDHAGPLAHPDQATSPFIALTRSPDPPLDELLLALTAEFRPVDRALARERLDDLSRCLFGLDGLDAAGQAGCVAHALRYELGLRPLDSGDPEALFLDRVLERREGHPLLLAVVAVELARRAGAIAAVCSAPTRLFAGFGDAPSRLVELTRPAGPVPDPATVVRHGSHAVAFGILGGLSDGYAHLPGRSDEAHQAFILQRVLRQERTAAQRRG